MAQTANTITANIADKVIDNGVFKMNWNTGKLEACQECPELPKGTIIHAYGAYMSHTRWAMTGEGRECVKLSENDADTYFSNPFHTLDKYAEPVAKKFGIGFYYDLDATPATDEEIAAAIERGRAFLKQQEDEKAEAARAWDQGVAETRAKYAGQFEERPGAGYGYAVHVAKNVRKDLARNFPGFKFSVRKYGFDEIRIEWTDGPTVAEVEAVAGKHKETAERDRWNDDLWDYTETYFTAVFGGVRYIWYDRDISKERTDAKKAEIEAVCPATAGEGFHESKMDETPGAWDMWNRFDLHGSGLYWYTSEGVARVVLSRESFYTAPEKKAEGETKGEARSIEAAGLVLVDYSEKALAITGDTKPHAETLKGLGGRFNARLSCGPGWVFSKTKAGEIREALGLSL